MLVQVVPKLWKIYLGENGMREILWGYTCYVSEGADTTIVKHIRGEIPKYIYFFKFR